MVTFARARGKEKPDQVGVPPACDSAYKFTGYERDGESGVDYASARHFSSTIGRFMQPDPLSGSPGNPQSWNRYSYVYNNPLNLTDSTGMDPCDDDPFACSWFWDGGASATGWVSMFPIDFSSVDLFTNPLTGENDPSTGFMQSPGLASQYLMQQQIGTVQPWSLGWQISASWSYLGKEAVGVCNATACGLYSMARHPIDTLGGIAFLISALPGQYGGGNIEAQMQIYDAASAWGSRLASGDPTAIGEAVGTGALIASPFAKSVTKGSFLDFSARRYPGAGGFGIGVSSASNAKRYYFRFDMHTLHFNGRPINLVPHLDLRWGNLLKFKHFPWEWFQ